LLLGEGKVTVQDVSAAVANSSRYDVYGLADAAMAGDAPRAVKILGGLRAEGVEPVIVMWALTRELRTLATLDDAVRQGTDLGSAMQAARVWNNRRAAVLPGISMETFTACSRRAGAQTLLPRGSGMVIHGKWQPILSLGWRAHETHRRFRWHI
jgi:DNA polymerase III delta subunit